MPFTYTKERYKLAIEAYRKGDDSMFQIVIKDLVRGNVPSYDTETSDFINEALQLAKKYNHRNNIASLTELSYKIGGYAKTSILEDALETEHECVVAINKCLENGQYQSVLTRIVEFIRKKRQFHTALMVLQEIDKSVHLDTKQKEDVALYFIERMDKVITKDIQVKSILGLHYKSDAWGKNSFKNDDYVHYTDLVKHLKKAFKKGNK